MRKTPREKRKLFEKEKHGKKMKPIKQSIALIIYNPERTKILVVQRPSDDDLFPLFWGLPSASLKPEESAEQAVIRAGKEKLGVDVRIIKLLNQGTQERVKHILHMQDYDVAITKGIPKSTPIQ